jgi:hypothetical protein
MPSFLFASMQSCENSGAGIANETIDKTGFQTIGKTTFSVLFWDIYKSQLLTTTGGYPIRGENEQLIYEICYLADISSEDLIKRTEEQWEFIGLYKSDYQSFIPMLESIWPDIKKGDTLTLLLKKGVSIFYYNQKRIGSIHSPYFAHIFLDIWLAKNTSQPSLRYELLGMDKRKTTNETQ